MSEKMDILVVEDSDNDFFFIERALKGLKKARKFQRVLNGEEALEYLRDHEETLPRVILMDIHMPVMNGYACLENIKALPKFRYIPVLIFSTMGTDYHAHRSLDLHAASHIVKPSTFAEYQRILQSVEFYWFGTTLLPPS